MLSMETQEKFPFMSLQIKAIEIIKKIKSESQS